MGLIDYSLLLAGESLSSYETPKQVTKQIELKHAVSEELIDVGVASEELIYASEIS